MSIKLGVRSTIRTTECRFLRPGYSQTMKGQLGARFERNASIAAQLKACNLSDDKASEQRRETSSANESDSGQANSTRSFGPVMPNAAGLNIATIAEGRGKPFAAVQ